MHNVKKKSRASSLRISHVCFLLGDTCLISFSKGSRTFKRGRLPDVEKRMWVNKQSHVVLNMPHARPVPWITWDLCVYMPAKSHECMWDVHVRIMALEYMYIHTHMQCLVNIPEVCRDRRQVSGSWISMRCIDTHACNISWIYVWYEQHACMSHNYRRYVQTLDLCEITHRHTCMQCMLLVSASLCLC